jgi:hypothetical protein
VLIHWSGEEVRRATLAVAASVLRHVPAEATYLNVQPRSMESESNSVSVRDLLDARSEAQAVHGLEMRTEMLFGNAADVLRQQLDNKPEQMLILGVTDRDEFNQHFAALLDTQPGWPVLIVFRAGETSAQRKLA